MSMANSIMVNLSITSKSYQFVGNKYRASEFLKKQRNNVSCFLIHCSKKMNNKHSQVFLKISVPNLQKKSLKMKLQVNEFQAEGLHSNYCSYFQTNLLCFNKVFLMSVSFTEQLFLEKTLYRCFLHNDHLPCFQELL